MLALGQQRKWTSHPIILSASEKRVGIVGLSTLFLEASRRHWSLDTSEPKNVILTTGWGKLSSSFWWAA
jgi:hypothetical protein